MELNEMTVGPIIGETTANRVRIWGRGEVHVVDDELRRCFGALRIRELGTKKWSKTQLFKMNPNFDMTGIAIVTGLGSETRYEYETGYFYSEADLTDAGFNNSDWTQVSRHKFTTASDNDKKERTLIIGSCRYLLKIFFGDFFDSRGDKTFASITKHITEKNQPIHQLIMMGDQIYADDLSWLNPDKTVSKFYKRYRDSFTQTHIRKLMAQVPTYMILDDHEIEDNWPEKASSKDWKTLYPNAMHAYQAYQLGHGPCIPVSGKKLSGTLNKIWYKYTDGCCDIFVTDSRTERVLNGTREMFSKDQMRALKRWISDDSGRVKIIVTSVPFVPDSGSDESTDKWSGFDDQRKEILGYIEEKQVNKVVFFSGDVHASLSVELVSETGLKIVSVISSAFFWPYPHPSARHFKTRGTIDGGKAGIFSLQNASKVISDDNYTKIDVAPKSINIEVYDRKGKGKSTVSYTF